VSFDGSDIRSAFEDWLGRPKEPPKKATQNKVTKPMVKKKAMKKRFLSKTERNKALQDWLNKQVASRARKQAEATIQALTEENLLLKAKNTELLGDLDAVKYRDNQKRICSSRPETQNSWSTWMLKSVCDGTRSYRSGRPRRNATR
jgi:ribosomal protein L16 Arg81 hydroxylase